ncbi:MAG: hypothetical protein U1F36_04175 [Planctomycetota bacterium]
MVSRLSRHAALRFAVLAMSLPLGLVLGGCNGKGSATGSSGSQVTGNARLQSVAYGRLMDVYGLRTASTGGTVIEPYRSDVLVGPDIQDERPAGSTLGDSEILYDFIGTNPDNLQGRVLITREIGSAEFDAAFSGLGARLREVSAGVFGQNASARPFSVVPRNAALELRFSDKLGITEDFFVARDATGAITGIRNTEAVQLLEIQGDPNDSNPAGDFRVIPIRVVVREKSLILDPVLLGSEGARYQVRNNASGLPASSDQLGANIRLAIALEGPLRIRGIAGDLASPYVGTNNQGEQSVIRDFRSGNASDNSADIARGFVRDPERPRIVGEMLMYVASVEQVDSGTQIVRLFKGDVDHKIDIGDVVRAIDPATNDVLGAGEIIQEPDDPIPPPGTPTQRIVRCVIRSIPGFAALDPRTRPDYPGNGAGLEAWLLHNAPHAVLIAEFTASRVDNTTGFEYRDDPVNFLEFSPTPLPLLDGTPSPSNQNVSPYAEAIIRFTKPVDMDTVRAHDSFFFATRNVLDPDVISAEFIQPRNIDPARFSLDKFKTPHLIASRVIDEDGSQTSIRLQSLNGLYIDEEMRTADEGVAFDQKRFRYFLHVLGGIEGIRDLTGNPVDFQALSAVRDFLVVPFSIDTRKDASNIPFYADNLTISVVRRVATRDEDEQPSLYRDAEAPRLDPNNGQPLPQTMESYPLDDLFGAVSYLSDGRLQARLTARAKKVVDDVNQLSPPPQTSIFRYCAERKAAEPLIASATASVRFGTGIQNPLNPWGCRLQTLWRELDLSLSRLDPLDFNLDVEQMWWAPFTNSAITYDVLDRVSLYLGHAESRPEPCVGSFSALAELPNSGLIPSFQDNYVHNRAVGTGTRENTPPPFEAYVDQQLTIDQGLAVFEPNQVNRFLPLPTFQKPYFVYRDETVIAQGGNSHEGADQPNANQSVPPYLISPFLGGFGRSVTPQTGGGLAFAQDSWYNLENYHLNPSQRSTVETFTDGLVGTVALPLLADFWTYCDDPDLPAGNGFLATGFNGWQIALTVQSGPQPNFRNFSAGFAGTSTRRPICVSPGSTGWNTGTGGYTPTGGAVPGQDNSMYWVMVDFLKRQTVVTAGFVDLFNPHRMPARTPGTGDPRLGPYLIDAGGNSSLPQGWLPSYSWLLDPPTESLPAGTAVLPEFRAAGPIDSDPWAYIALRGIYNPPRNSTANFPAPDAVNFPLDPLKAGDAHIRKYDDRLVSGQSREWWTYLYNKNLTEYTRDVGDLRSDAFVGRYAGPRDVFLARDVRYVNWRFLMRNNVDANPPVSPAIDSFLFTYRFERLR